MFSTNHSNPTSQAKAHCQNNKVYEKKNATNNRGILFFVHKTAPTHSPAVKRVYVKGTILISLSQCILAHHHIPQFKRGGKGSSLIRRSHPRTPLPPKIPLLIFLRLRRPRSRRWRVCRWSRSCRSRSRRVRSRSRRRRCRSS